MTVVFDDKAVFGNGFTNNGKVEVPFLKYGARFGLKLWFEDHEHAFLAFRQHHLISGHVIFALWHGVQVQFDAQAALVTHFHRRAGQASSPHILD